MDRPVRCTIDEEPPVLDISDDESCASLASLPRILSNSDDEPYAIDEEDEDEDNDADDHLPPWLWARGPWAAQREDDGNATQGSDSDLATRTDRIRVTCLVFSLARKTSMQFCQNCKVTLSQQIWRKVTHSAS